MPTPEQDSSFSSANKRFSPLDLPQLSEILRAAMESQPRVALPGLEPFDGAGLYALYYTGDLPMYAELRGTQVPVYVGKAEAGNSSYGDPPDERKPSLFKRIEKHRTSVDEADNLRVSDFEVRYLVLDDVWIVLGERALLRSYAPVLWNTLLTGFGANPPGTARTNPRSFWDTMHPGRPRAANFLCNRALTRQEIQERVVEGIAVSLMPPGGDRDLALATLRGRKRRPVWSLPKRGDVDKRWKVYRPDAFTEENAAFGVAVESELWREAEASAAGELFDVSEVEDEGDQ